MEIVIIGKIAGVMAYSLLEYWLGRTDKTKAGSVVELVLNAASKVFVKGDK